MKKKYIVSALFLMFSSQAMDRCRLEKWLNEQWELYKKNNENYAGLPMNTLRPDYGVPMKRVKLRGYMQLNDKK